MDLQFIVTKQFKLFGQQEENSTSYRTGNEVTDLLLPGKLVDVVLYKV